MLSRSLRMRIVKTLISNGRLYTALMLGSYSSGGTDTILDSSPSNFAVTKVGNPAQGSYNPFGDNWSVYFNGQGDLLHTPSNPNTLNIGTNDFTIEYWFKPATKLTGFVGLLNVGPAGSGGSGRGYSTLFNDGLLAFMYGNTTLYFGSHPTDTSWHHLAYVKHDSTVYCYLDGKLSGIPQSMGAVQPIIATDYCGIGGFDNSGNGMPGRLWFRGSLSNLRIVKDIAVYLEDFIPAVTPLTAIAGTQLLCCQSNRFVDNSLNNFTIIPAGTIKISHQTPYTTVYNPGIQSGSMFFNGTTDYVKFGSVGAFATANFTVEFWFNVNTTISQILCCLNSSSYGIAPICLWLSNTTVNRLTILMSSNGTSWNIAVDTVPLDIASGTWNHCAVVRTGTSIKLYINGVAYWSITTSASLYNGTKSSVGGRDKTGLERYTNGYITNYRVVIGSALYTTNFNPPVAPLSAIANTALLLLGTNSSITDSSCNTCIIPIDTVSVDTSIVRYGNQSYKFNGTTDYLVIPTSQDIQLDASNFTVECWFNSASITKKQILFWLGGNSDASSYAGLNIEIYNSKLYFSIGTTGTAWALSQSGLGPSLNSNTWYHLAIVRSDTSITIYLDGIAVYQNIISGALYQGPLHYIGNLYYGGGNFPFNGNLADIAIYKYAKYTTGFTPSTQAITI